MESLLNSLSLGFVLRCFFAGIFGVISFRVARGGAESLEALLKFEPHLLGLALFGGATIYGVHRSLLYPVIEVILDSPKAKSCRKRAPLISQHSLRALLKRWERSAEKDNPNSGIVKYTAGWGDWAHMQYSSTWCIVAGAIGAATTSTSKLEWCVPLITIGVLLALSAFVSDWRLHSVEDYLSSGK